ncbi:maleylpyruvate isomerase family mycothiol-dependent enzyme [Dactylosporangium sp. NPDC049140]|uniref:maleylpyruvate isomerase family mycothiol-dependent enzyme n=1 Tax=Dactylosporangium sp. NPDC049140 TaxID=3155647 RepID=UPI0034082913
MTDDDVRAALAKERMDLVEVLAGLTLEQWDAPTLCAGWRVREVVAHTTQPFRTSAARTLLELARDRGNFNRMADRTARRDAARMSAGQLLAAVRDNAGHPWTPPGGGPVGALSHEVIHGLDITAGLGLDRRVPLDRIAAVLGGMKPRNIAFFGVDLQGVRLEANDLEWHHGTGEPVRGAAQDLLLVICARRLPAGRLEGAAAGRFSG